MKCTTCNTKLDLRKKSSYTYASYALGESVMDDMLKKNQWVFCNRSCKLKADADFLAGDFKSKHGKKKIDFKP